jgi:hypothetical protein
MAEDLPPNWSVETLFGLTGDAFERERNRIISEFIKAQPEDRRKKVQLQQLNIDIKRHQMGDADFAKWLAAELTENLENLGDQMSALKSIIVGPPSVAP